MPRSPQMFHSKKPLFVTKFEPIRIGSGKAGFISDPLFVDQKVPFFKTLALFPNRVELPSESWHAHVDEKQPQIRINHD